MKTQIPQLQGNKPPKHKNVALFSIVLIMIIGGTIVWIMNIEGLIIGSWSSILGPIFTSLGVILALFQWHAQVNSEPPALSRDSPIYKFRQWGHYHELGCIDFGVNKQRGALVVYTHKKLRGTTIYLCRGFDITNRQIDLATNVVKRSMNGHDIYVGLFPSLEPNNYTIYTNLREHLAKTTVYVGHIAEIDWQ